MKNFKKIMIAGLSVLLLMGCTADRVTLDNLQDKIESEAGVKTKELSFNLDAFDEDDDLEDTIVLEDEDGSEIIAGKLSDDADVTNENIGKTKVGDIIGHNAVVHNGYVYRIRTSFKNYEKCKKVLDRLGD